VPTASGITTSAILTVGQSVNLKPGSTAPYRFCGIPDGLGAFDNLDGTFTLLMTTSSIAVRWASCGPMARTAPSCRAGRSASRPWP
jgi:hypothetical protein